MAVDGTGVYGISRKKPGFGVRSLGALLPSTSTMDIDGALGAGGSMTKAEAPAGDMEILHRKILNSSI
jgi:hypothetical protein